MPCYSRVGNHGKMERKKYSSNSLEYQLSGTRKDNYENQAPAMRRGVGE